MSRNRIPTHRQRKTDLVLLLHGQDDPEYDGEGGVLLLLVLVADGGAGEGGLQRVGVLARLQQLGDLIERQKTFKCIT